MDVVNAEQAKIAEAAGACSVMALKESPPISAPPGAWHAWRILDY
jgi:pyridoxal biosynthesis lyase PdxS